jgi:hypothetical protein
MSVRADATRHDHDDCTIPEQRQRRAPRVCSIVECTGGAVFAVTPPREVSTELLQTQERVRTPY